MEFEKVDYVITDTSLLLGLLYMPNDYFKWFKPLLLEVFNSYNNINIFINRPDSYSQIGRTQTLEEAIEIDKATLALLEDNNVPHLEISCGLDIETLLSTVLSYESCNLY